MAVQLTDELRVLVEAEVERAIRDLKQFDDSLEKSEKSASGLGKALEAMEKKALIMSGAVTAAGLAGIKAAADNEKLQASLEVLLGSAEKATAVFEEWKHFGATTPLSVGEISGAGKALLAFGVDASEITTTLRRLGDVAQGVGSSLDQVAQVYGKVKVQGKASAMEILQMQRQGIPVVQALAKALGTTEASIKDMVSAGKIGFPEMEKAFQAMTEDGGQFEGMMERLSVTTIGKFSTAMDNAKQAAASFGDLLLPMVNDTLNAANDLFQGIMNMDDGTKRLVLGFGGVVAVSGPTIAAIHGINKVLAATNPAMLAIVAGIAGLGAVVAVINKQAHAYEDLQKKIRETEDASKSLLAAYSGGNDAKLLDEKTTRELIKLYPELSKVIMANTITVKEASAAAEEASYFRRLAAAEQKYAYEIERYQGELGKLNNSVKEMEASIANGYYTGEHLQQIKQDLAESYAMQSEYFDKITELTNRTLVEAAGPRVAVTASADTVSFDPPELGSGTTKDAQKTWQEWYSEITKVDPKLITMKEHGEELGNLFVDSLANTYTMNQNLADVLGNKFDMAGALRGQKDDIERALKELLSISPSDIDDPFEFNDKFINPLSEEFKRLNHAIGDIEIQELEKKIKDFGKSEWQLAREMAEFNGYTKEQQEEIARLTEEYAMLTEAERNLEDVIRNGLTKSFPEMSKIAVDSIAKISAALADVSFNGILKGLEDVGYALAQNDDAAKAFKAAMADMVRSMMDMLPGLFLEAGLRLIISGQWPLGLAFIAMAGSSALINGITKGLTSSDGSDDTDLNAHGNMFSSQGIIPYGKGGAFTNQIITAPSYFRHGGGLGLMGEAGPEAVMPLKRLGNGDLGIEASGIGGTQVVVNIYNNSGEPVTQEEHTGEDGSRQIDIMIGELVGGQIAAGRHDSVLESRFEGLTRRGR